MANENTQAQGSDDLVEAISLVNERTARDLARMEQDYRQQQDDLIARDHDQIEKMLSRSGIKLTSDELREMLRQYRLDRADLDTRTLPPVNPAPDVFAQSAHGSAPPTADEIAVIKATILQKYGFEVTDAYAADLITFVSALTPLNSGTLPPE